MDFIKKILFSSAVILVFAALAVEIWYFGGDKPYEPVKLYNDFAGIKMAENSFTDLRDGQVYGFVKIGTYTWMAQNLKYETGTSWCFDNDKRYCQRYGRLYDWDTAMVACPAGWRLPTRVDWDDLVEAAGGSLAAGGALKAAHPQWDGTDSFGFSALPVGPRYFRDGSLNAAGVFGVWWSAADYGGKGAYRRNVRTDHKYVYEYLDDKNYGFSVRCVMNNA